MFLLRDLVSARTWLAMTQHLAGLFIGFAAIFIFTFGLGFGAGFVFLGARRHPDPRHDAAAGRLVRRGPNGPGSRSWLGAAIPAWPAQNRAGYRWGIVPRLRMFTERATWAEIGYGLLRLPFSAVALTLSVARLGGGPGRGRPAGLRP